MSAYREGVPCPTCKSRNTSSEGECLECHAVWGEVFRCPFCEAYRKPVPDALVGAVCPGCAEPRLDARLARDAYSTLVRRRRAYRRWHARALAYIPPVALALAFAVTGLGYQARASALAARAAEQAELGRAPTEVAFATRLPEAGPTFLFALVGLGALGIALYLLVAFLLRARVLAEVSRLADAPAHADA